MLLFEISDKFVKIADFSPTLLGGRAINAYKKESIKEGLVSARDITDPKVLAEEVKKFLEKNFKVKEKQECAFILHDERVFTLRLNVPQSKGGKSDSDLINEKVRLFIPQPPSAQVSAHKRIGGDKNNEVQFVAVDKEFFAKYLDFFGSLNLKPALAVSESYAFYTVFAPQIKEGETVLYLNVEEDVADAVILDKFGVLQTFTEPIDANMITEGLKDVFAFLKERWGRSISRIFIGGEGSASVDSKELAENLGVEILAADKAIEKYPVKFGSGAAAANKLEMLNLIGLAELSTRKDPINLV